MSMSTTLKEPAAPARPRPAGCARPGAPPASLALVLLIVALWEAAVRLLQVSAFVVPAPSAHRRRAVRTPGRAVQASLVTGAEILYGFLCSCVVGIALALLVDRYAWFGRASYPLIVLFQNVPKIALAPLLILWFGYDLLPKIALIVIMAFFPVTEHAGGPALGRRQPDVAAAVHRRDAGPDHGAREDPVLAAGPWRA